MAAHLLRALRRWRSPLLAGAAIWLLSFPLLTAHPSALRPVAAATAPSAQSAAGASLHSRRVVLPALLIGVEAPAPTPAPASAAVAAPRAPAAPHVAPPVRPPAPPAPRRIGANWIYIPRLGLSQPVGWYGDCLGRSAVPRWGTWRWSCAGANNTYIMAHNPGTFTPILGLRAGDVVQYGDPSGRVHTYHVSYTTIVSNTQIWPLGATGVSSLTLQTCWTWDGSRDFIVRAVEG